MTALSPQDLDRSEILRYLGWRGQALDERLETQLEEAVELVFQNADPRCLWQIYPIAEAPYGISVPGTVLTLTGESIREHLAGAESAALLACTLGAGMERLLSTLSRTAVTKGLIADAAATEYLEKLCDKAEEEIREKAAQSGLVPNFRFSPGYGDLPLEVQPALLGALNAEKLLGITCTERLLMIPRKSVTAVIGLFAGGARHEKKPSCEKCNLKETCSYRKKGMCR